MTEFVALIFPLTLSFLSYSRKTYGLLFDWLYPARMPLLLKAITYWADTPEVNKHLIEADFSPLSLICLLHYKLSRCLFLRCWLRFEFFLPFVFFDYMNLNSWSVWLNLNWMVPNPKVAHLGKGCVSDHILLL